MKDESLQVSKKLYKKTDWLQMENHRNTTWFKSSKALSWFQGEPDAPPPTTWYSTPTSWWEGGLRLYSSVQNRTIEPRIDVLKTWPVSWRLCWHFHFQDGFSPPFLALFISSSETIFKTWKFLDNFFLFPANHFSSANLSPSTLRSIHSITLYNPSCLNFYQQPLGTQTSPPPPPDQHTDKCWD